MPGAPPFRDRRDAGRRLAALLGALPGTPVVVALPRGGVPVGAEVAAAIGAPLELLVVRKIGATRQPEWAVGAIAEGGVVVLDRESVRLAAMSEAEVAATVAAERRELGRRVDAYRASGHAPALAGRTAVIVDDGLATGLSDLAAVRAARAGGATRVIVAAPVASADAVAMLEREADAVICALVPDRFAAVGAWYADFEPVSDAAVLALLHRGGPANGP